MTDDVIGNGVGWGSPVGGAEVLGVGWNNHWRKNISYDAGILPSGVAVLGRGRTKNGLERARARVLVYVEEGR